MLKVRLSNEMLKYITAIEENKYMLSTVNLPRAAANRLRKNSKKSRQMKS